MPKDLVINNGKLDTSKLIGAPNVRDINYILNADAEVDLSGWVTYADAAQALPVDGVGGSPQANLWIRSTTTPLRGTGSFRLDKTGSATRQGQGVAYDFSIDKSDQAKVLSISFDYEVVSGTYASGDVTVYIYDVTNAQVIQPAGFQVENVASGIQNKVIATFQTASNSTSYRLILHIATASTQNYTLAIDNVSCGPQSVQYGAPVTDWQSYTSTLNSNLSVSSQSFFYARRGDSIIIRGAVSFNGVGQNSTFTFSTPLGITMDTSKFPSTGTSSHCGYWMWYDDAGSAATRDGKIERFSDTSFVLRRSDTSNLLNSNLTGSNDVIAFLAEVPVAGWSSSLQLSDSTDTRVVAAAVTTGTATSVSSNTLIPFGTVEGDTHGGWSTVNNDYEIKVPGWYQFDGQLTYGGTTSPSSLIVSLQRNTVTIRETSIGQAGLAGGFNPGIPFSFVLFANAGEKYRIVASSGPTQSLTTSSPHRTRLNIHRLSGPSVIAATESVYFIGNGLPLNSAYTSTTAIRYPVIRDTHSAYNTTTGQFTAPISGLYLVQAYNDVSSTLSQGNVIRVYINNVNTAILGINYVNNYPVTGSTTVYVLAGDTIDFRISANTTLSAASRATITRVGN